MGNSNTLGSAAYQEWANKYHIDPVLNLPLDASGRTAQDSASLSPSQIPPSAQKAAQMAMAGTGISSKELLHPPVTDPVSANVNLPQRQGKDGATLTA
jgi:hypothetical protein